MLRGCRSPSRPLLDLDRTEHTPNPLRPLPREIRCGTHGRVPLALIGCAFCGRLHDPDDAPKECRCGERLLPAAPGVEYGAYPMCAWCAAARWTRRASDET